MGDGLASFVAAALDLVFDFLSKDVDVCRGRWVEVGFRGGLGQLDVARAERSDLAAEVADAGAEHVLGDRPGFEGVHVALDGSFTLLELCFGGGDLVLVEPGGAEGVAGLGGDGSLDEVGVGVQGDECFALQRAVAAYDGDLLAGTDHPWVEPARQDLHRRAVDAHLRLGELEERAGASDAAIEVLERVIALDRYTEEPYRRLMYLYAATGEPDALRATWHSLHRSLAEIDADIDDTTTLLYNTLTTTDRDMPRPIPLSS